MPSGENGDRCLAAFTAPGGWLPLSRGLTGAAGSCGALVLVESGDYLGGEAAATVAGVVDDDEAAVGPRSVELPGGVEGAGDVVAAVDEDPGDPGEAVHAREYLTVGEVAAV